MSPFDRLHDLLSVCHCNYSSTLYSFWIIWRWIISQPCNVGYGSLKVTANATIQKLGYSFLLAFHSTTTIAVSLVVSEILSIKFRVCKWSVSICKQNVNVQQIIYDLLLVSYCDYSSHTSVNDGNLSQALLKQSAPA